jgi:hypothetical protein
MDAALSLPSHGEQQVSLCSSRSAVPTAHSCMYAHACGAVSAIAWRTVCKSLLFPQRSTHSSLVCMCMHVQLSLPSHCEQAVSLCSFCSAAQHSQLTRVYVHACGAVSAIAWGTASKSLLFPQRSTHSSLVCMCVHVELSLLSHGEQAALPGAQHSQLIRVHAALSLLSHVEQEVSNAAEHAHLHRVCSVHKLLVCGLWCSHDCVVRVVQTTNCEGKGVLLTCSLGMRVHMHLYVT